MQVAFHSKNRVRQAPLSKDYRRSALPPKGCLKGDLDNWHDWKQYLGIEDLRAFVIVAYFHAAGYLGALAGLILAVVYVRRCLAKSRQA